MKVYFFPHLTGKVFNPCKEIITVLDIFFNLKNFNLFSLKIFCIYYGWMVDNFNFCALLVLSKFSIKSLHSGLPRWFSSAKKKKKNPSVNSRDTGSILDLVRYHMPWEQLNLCTATLEPVLYGLGDTNTEPMCSNYWSWSSLEPVLCKRELATTRKAHAPQLERE